MRRRCPPTPAPARGRLAYWSWGESYHEGVWEIVWLLVIIGAIALIAAPWLMRRRPQPEPLHGTLLITGVSPRPDATGEQFVTLSGVINGPTVAEHVVYQ